VINKPVLIKINSSIKIFGLKPCSYSVLIPDQRLKPDPLIPEGFIMNMNLFIHELKEPMYMCVKLINGIKL